MDRALKCPECGAAGDDLKLMAESQGSPSGAEGEYFKLPSAPMRAYQCVRCGMGFTRSEPMKRLE